LGHDERGEECSNRTRVTSVIYYFFCFGRINLIKTQKYNYEIIYGLLCGMSYSGISVKFMSNVLIVNRSSLEMPDAGQRPITAIAKQKVPL
jgi:hypothetical protein